MYKRQGLETEITYLINAVTTNKTDFFREPEHFELMQKKLVAELVAQRRDRLPLLKVWSAASSTGAEAYTTAMVLADMVSQRRDFRFAVLGTDISTDVLETGRRAIYPAEQIVPVPPGMQSRYLMQARRPGARPEVRVVPELRRLVRFDQLNLMQESYPYDRDVDIILLRNVLIYFEKADQATLDPPPPVSAGWGDQVIQGIGRRNGEFVTVLDLDRMLGSIPLPATRAA